MSLPVLLLTEDGARTATHVLRAVVKDILKAAVPTVRTHLLDFQPGGEDASVAMRANRWKSRAARDETHRVALRKSIATTLLQPGLVFFHFDGDKTWSERASCQNDASFRQAIVPQVREIIRGVLRKKGVADSELESRATEVLSRLILVVPFYSIESWLYQCTRKALEIVDRDHAGKDRELFLAWGSDRARLDELSMPKEMTCLRDRHNLDLASDGLPVREMLAIGKSFAAAVGALSQNDSIADMLLGVS